MTEPHQNNFTESDAAWMSKAFELAKKAASQGEVPVGAVIVKDNVILGQGFNLRETEQNPVLHAEIIAIQEASRNSNAWRLTGSTLYVTLEPCLMCTGAIVHARIQRVVFSAFDPKAGACGSLYHIHEDARLNHRFLVESGLLSAESSQLLKDFFRARRQQ